MSYYDLIELPSGRHLPVPIAVVLVGWDCIAKIPVSRKVRDRNFFYCEKCESSIFYKCKEVDHIEPWKEKQKNNRMKELAFIGMVENNEYKKMRYIKADCRNMY